MLIANHNDRWSDLLHRELRKLALGRLQYVLIAASTAAPNLRLRRFQGRQVIGVHKSHRGFWRRCRRDDATPDHYGKRDRENNQRVIASDSYGSNLPVGVEAPNVFYGLRLGFQLEWRKLFGEEKFVDLADEMFVQRLFVL